MEFNYMFLDRLRCDCEYYLNCGRRNKKVLYYQDETEHIEKMKELYNKFSDEDKPKWLTMQDILDYKKKMIG